MADYTTPLGKTRLLSADLDEASPLITDDVLNGYLALNDGNPYRAAADALDAMATSETLLSKKIRTQDLQTDGPAVAADLRKRAYWLRNKADTDERDAEQGYFEIIPSSTEYAEAAERPIW